MKKNLQSSLMIFPVLSTYYLIDRKVMCVRGSQGQSMMPTLMDNSILIIDHLFYKWNGLKIGDIVAATQPTDPTTSICKRIKQIPGGRVSIGMGQQIILQQGHYWLEGDNKNNSYDSRHHGPVPYNLIDGKVIAFFDL